MRDVDAVTFDVDGTLYTQRMIAPRFLFANALEWRAVRASLRAREALRGRVFDDGAAMRAAEAELVAAALGVDAARARSVVDRVIDDRVAAALRAVGPVPGARAALERLVAAGLRVAVVSDRRVDDKLAAMRLDDLPWAARVSAEEHGALKPHPRGLVEAARRMGVDPARVVHVGDRPETDGAAARAGGTRFVLVGRRTDHDGRRGASLAAAADAILRADP